MKIVFVTTHLTVFGGGGIFIRDFANELSANGHRITIVAQKINTNNYKFNANISLIEVGGPLPSKPLYWIKFREIKMKYLNVLNRLNSGILISIHFPTNYFCSKFYRKNNYKHIYYCLEPYRPFHDKFYYLNTSIMEKIRFFMLRVFFKKYDIEGACNADRIICISNFIKNKVRLCYDKIGIVNYFGVEIKNVFNVERNLNTKLRLLSRSNKRIILTLGLTHHMKGIKDLINIFKKVLIEMPETILIIVGWMSKRVDKLIKKYVKNSKIPFKNIKFCGFVNNEVLTYLYKKSFLTFYTAIEESFGLIPLESMKYGTPVIAFKGGGPPETILNGETGYLIKYGDLDKFVEKAITLIKNKDLYMEFSKKAQKHVKQNFSLENSVSNLELLFQKLIYEK